MRCLSFASVASLLVLLTNLVAVSSKVFRGVQARQQHRCFQNTSVGVCETLLRKVSEERVRQRAEQKATGRHAWRLKTQNSTATAHKKTDDAKLPGEGEEPAWAAEEEEYGGIPQRLLTTCDEPEDPPQTVGGYGPDEIYCCHTAEALVADLVDRQDHCDSDPPVDCWESLKAVLPNYINYYTKRRDWLCRTTTTTTTTITTTTVTTTTVKASSDDLKGKDGEGKGSGDGGGAGGSDASGTGFDMSWCLDMCKDKMKKTDCQAMCDKVAKKMAEKQCKAELNKTPPAPAPANFFGVGALHVSGPR